MKKKIIATLLTVCLVLSMTACGSNENTDATTTQDEVADVEADDTTDVEADDATDADDAVVDEIVEDENNEEEATDATEAATTLEDYFATPEGQAIIDEAKAISMDGMSIDVFAEDNSFVYVYDYTAGSLDSSLLDAVAEQLVAALEAQSSTFTSIASQMNTLIGSTDCSVVVRYTYEGETLAEMSFLAE